MRYKSILILAALVGLGGTGRAGADHAAADGAASGTAGLAQPPAAPADDVAQPSQAERITRVRRAIQDAEQQTAELGTRLQDALAEYSAAETAFQELDRELETRKKELDLHREAGDTARVEALQGELEALQPRWDLAKERFDLAIQDRRTLSEQLDTLEQKLAQDRAALTRLEAPESGRWSPPAGELSPGPSAAPPQEAAEPPAVSDAAPASASAPLMSPAGSGATSAPAPSPAARDAALATARHDADVRQAEALEAEAELASINERLEAVRHSAELERKLLDNAQKKVDNSRETQRAVNEETRRRWVNGAPQAELEQLWEEAAQARQRLSESEAAARQHSRRIDQLQTELQGLQSEQIRILERAQAKRQQADAARRVVARLENPFSPRNLLQWVLDHGPRLLGIVLGIFALLWFARVFESRIVHLLAGRAGHGTVREREDRARTLVAVFHNTVSVAVISGGIFMILAEIGLNIVPLMGGAAVVGLAVAFAAQSLIKDYFYGFIVLLENQYGINDVVRIGSISGQVERITLRMTVLRDVEGVVHFIPNGQITTLSNLTHGWSRVVLDVSVNYRENVDQVSAVLLEVGRALRQDPQWAALLLDDGEVAGVERLGESSVDIRFLMKTRPQQQWAVRRELLRRIKNRFDELGIEIPYPHRTVVWRGPAGPGDAAAP